MAYLLNYDSIRSKRQGYNENEPALAHTPLTLITPQKVKPCDLDSVTFDLTS